MPKVSVIIPTYNCAPYIKEAIDSVLKQTFNNYEVIVIDSSTDDTKVILHNFYRDRIRYYFQNNQGVSAARNFGIREANGKYIAFLDGDDIWFPEKLELQVKLMELYTDAGFTFSDGETFGDNKVLRYSWAWSENVRASDNFQKKVFEKKYNDGSIIYGRFFNDMLFNNFVSTCSVCVRKSAIDDVGMFDTNLAVCEDYDLWLRIARKYSLAYLNRKTARYRIHLDGLSGDFEIRPFLYKKWHIKIYKKYLQLNHIPVEYNKSIEKMVKRYLLVCCWGYFNINDLKEVRELSINFLSTYGLNFKMLIYAFITFLPIRIATFIRKLKFLLCQKSV